VRCVIVDDNPAVLQAASNLLEGEGLEIVGTARSSDEAVRLVDELAPDVVLIDIDLGPESGLELTRRLSAPASAPGPASVLISTHDLEDYADLVAASPAIGFLSKSDLSAAAVRRLLSDAQGEGRS
jgi:DNA-binding NarL/FixJ family response regulator